MRKSPARPGSRRWRRACAGSSPAAPSIASRPPAPRSPVPRSPWRPPPMPPPPTTPSPPHAPPADGPRLPGSESPRAPRRDDGALQHALARLVASDAIVLVAGDRLEELADRRLRRLGPAEWTLEPGSRGEGPSWIRGASVEEALDRAARHVARGTVGLALGSGGAFGFAHLALLEALDSAGIPVDFVAGTSMGAIIGGMFATGLSPARGIEFS